MKGVCGSRKVSKLAPKDVISTMPEEVITNILHCLPLQDAVKTGILSKYWKFKWTLITQLVFDDNFYEYLEATENEKDYEWIISRVLLFLNGSITKFFLYLPDHQRVDVKHINNWIIYMYKKGIKEFTFVCFSGGAVELPTHLFSCLQLTHLDLVNCDLHPRSEFDGFPNLLSLDLSNVYFLTSKCWELLTQSTSVEILKLNFYDSTQKVNHVEIAKLENLKVLSLNLCDFENMTEIKSSIIFQLTASLPKLQELSLNFYNCKILSDAENRAMTFLPCLKILNLDDIDFRSGAMVSCAIELIKGSPILETLSIQGLSVDVVPLSETCSSEVEFSIMGQLQLLKVTLSYIRGLENKIFFDQVFT